jgi:RimJ/RimL family protein N-acetyltransferase
MDAIRGDRVVLRPFRAEEFAAWLDARLVGSEDRTVVPSGPPDPNRLKERIDHSGEMRDQSLDLAIESDGLLVGEIGTFADPEEGARPGLFLLSIGLFSPSDRGRGLGTEAVRLLCDWLFGSEGAERVESSTAVSNAAMRRVFDKLGFEFVREYRRWDVDWAHYAMTRAAWDTAAPVVNS